MSKPFWKTSLSSVEKNKILIRGYGVEDLMERCTFGDMIYLTFKGELPSRNEGRMIEMIMVSSTDHSFLAPSIDATRFVASGGVPLQASIAAGVISLGDHHGGAIEQCAKLLQESVRSGAQAADIVADAKTGDTAKLGTDKARWVANADEIAGFLSSANPKNWPAADMKRMMREHLDATTAELMARINKDWAADVAAYEKVHAQILHMADMLTDGIAKQFPEKVKDRAA